MGLSASQARLLSITARIGANEYESQQISNAKMRLATQSEEASQEYIDALNATQMKFLSYDAQGAAITTDLTANVLYQYADMKNQYSIVNLAGQVLISNEDAKNFEKSATLDEFLECYGIKKVYKTAELQASYEKLTSKDYKDAYDQWEGLVTNVRQSKWSVEYLSNITYTSNTMNEEYERKVNITAEKAYQYASAGAYLYYSNVDTNYKAAILADDTDAIDNWGSKYETAKQAIADCTTFQTWCNAMAKLLADGELYYNSEKEIYAQADVLKKDDNENSIDDNDNYNLVNKQIISIEGEIIDLSEAITAYYDELANFEFLAKDAGYTTLTETYTYSDPTKAQWYTNLWYRLNGDSSNKVAQNNTNYAVLDSNLAQSSDWLQDSLKQGIVTLEVATNENVSDVLENNIETLSDTLNIKLKGISWDAKTYTAVNDFTEAEDETAIAKATAEYERKTQEINVKDQKYQNRIKLLDTEHTALQAQYDSIKSAISENIKRSYSSFSG